MYNYIFGDAFDFNRDGQMDQLEQRAQFDAILNEIKNQEVIDKPLSEMSFDELSDLASKTGVDLDKDRF